MLSKTHRATALDTAEFAWDVIRLGLFYVAPIGAATFVAVGYLDNTGHKAAAGVLLIIEFLIGVALARTGARPARHRSPSVRRINRRAAIILPIAAVALATLLAALAVKPVVPVIVGLLLVLFGLPAALGAAVHLWFERRRIESAPERSAPAADDELATVYIGGRGQLLTAPATD
jgi:hypothetical protein